MHLYEGAAMAIRNPGAHRVGITEQSDRTLQHLELLSYLADRLDETKKACLMDPLVRSRREPSSRGESVG